MIFSNNKNEIVQLALTNLETYSGWQASWLPSRQGGFDGCLRLDREGKAVELEAEVKSTALSSHLPRLLQQKELNPNFILIAGRISMEFMEKLKVLGINYLESGGNAWINAKGLFLLIEGKKGGLALERKHLFTNASIQLIFHLLVKPELLTHPYRNIVAATGSSLDNISRTIHSLRENGYLTPLQKGGYVFSNKAGLIERWIPEYGERLKPKLLMGQFRFLKDDRWEDIILDTKKTLWGGEPAADKLLHSLRPEVFTIYTKESRQDLIKNYRMVSDPNGPVKVYQIFWDPAFLDHNETVPELLIYADLLLSGSPRNVEVAKNLFDAEKGIILPPV